MIDKFIAITRYPCHSNKQIKLDIWPTVPFQKFDRKCPVCSIKWTITTRVIKRNITGITITVAEWERVGKGYKLSQKGELDNGKR